MLIKSKTLLFIRSKQMQTLDGFQNIDSSKNGKYNARHHVLILGPILVVLVIFTIIGRIECTNSDGLK